MVSAYLKKMDINVIIFDWTEFSPCEYFYVTVVIVPKLVYEVNKIIEMLFEYGTTASLMHLIDRETETKEHGGNVCGRTVIRVK